MRKLDDKEKRKKFPLWLSEGERKLLELKATEYGYIYLADYIRDASIYESLVKINLTGTDELIKVYQKYLDEIKKFNKEVRRILRYDTSLSTDEFNKLQNNLFSIYSAVKQLKKETNEKLDYEIIETISKQRIEEQKLKYEDKLKNVNIIPCFGAGKIALMFGYLYGMGYDTYAMVDNDSDGINALKEIMGQDGENSIFYDKLHTYNLQLDESKAYLLENLFSKKDLNDNLIPKNTVLYRNFYDNVNSISFEKETLSNFKKLFDFIIDFMGGKNG